MKLSKKEPTSTEIILSDKDRLILDALRQSGISDSPKEISQRTGLAISTVAKRLRKLRASGVISTSVNLAQHLGYRALVSIDLDLTHINGPKYGYANQQQFVRFLKTGLYGASTFKAFTKEVVVEDAYSLLGGRSDVCLIASANDVEAMFEFVTSVIHALPGVKNTNTAAIARTI